MFFGFCESNRIISWIHSFKAVITYYYRCIFPFFYWFAKNFFRFL